MRQIMFRIISFTVACLLTLGTATNTAEAFQTVFSSNQTCCLETCHCCQDACECQPQMCVCRWQPLSERNSIYFFPIEQTVSIANHRPFLYAFRSVRLIFHPPKPLT